MSGQKATQHDQRNSGEAGEILKPADLGLQAGISESLAPEAFATVIRQLLQNNRQGTVGCKSRSEVSGSNKKPWKQKGTGRARSGARTSPLWRGGGIIFGPQPRVRKLKISKNLRRAVARDILTQMLENQRLIVLDWMLEGDIPKTKQAFLALRSINLHEAQINLFLPVEDSLTVASFANIPFVRIVFMDAPNAYALADAQYWVICKKDMDAFKDMIAQWK